MVHLLASAPPVHGGAGLGGIFIAAFLAAIWGNTGKGKGK